VGELGDGDGALAAGERADGLSGAVSSGFDAAHTDDVALLALTAQHTRP